MVIVARAPLPTMVRTVGLLVGRADAVPQNGAPFRFRACDSLTLAGGPLISRNGAGLSASRPRPDGLFRATGGG